VIEPIDTSLLPPDVRKAGPAAQQLYAGALAFEQQLTQQLTQSLADSAQAAGESDDDSEDSGDATTSMYKQMLPDAMSQGMTDAGGLGLARALYDQLRLRDGQA
jgi:Rod binding domain-containing protein